MNELHHLEKCRIATPSTDATYIVAGHVVAGTAGKQDLLLGESAGREAQANSRDTDVALKRLLKRVDKGGGSAGESNDGGSVSAADVDEDEFILRTGDQRARIRSLSRPMQRT